ncbi:zinc-dependent alcohol dehydrogenase family protein [Steroidobacter sp.]|uniref:zinc-dependent alcohol dehydrogenase family protein n=1 Tax=Steroidobacter sp. TaxID=1978227 RepID=UPI001A5C9CC2|nr:zinc-dependent alcohol dehydrogenase family protein [Steroidobacter sp.]MBL8265675.1 zinc-dependent alcohol dehydrogenase family protein [Steroidobacter sp.]
MKAVLFEQFGGSLNRVDVRDPTPTPGGVVIKVEASGICRSDWHGWMGHDADIKLPHVPGHELAGVVTAVGASVTRFKAGDRVTVPFVSGCGKCEQCSKGQQQICAVQFQPGFTAWGSFAEYVAIDYADINLVNLPSEIDFVTAASLGCRFATSFRAVVDQARVQPGEWVAIHGCGGVGLSAIMIANAMGARVIAVDIDQAKLDFARKLGAEIGVLATADVKAAIVEHTKGGAHASMDALGSRVTCYNSIACLRPQGRHVQVGLMLGAHADPPVPMGMVIAKELQVMGSHGMQAHRYDAMLDLILTGRVQPQRLVEKSIPLSQAAAILADMDSFRGAGITVINDFSH